jgi:hypothetical protein
MIFFFCGRPSALFMYQTSLIWVSFASEPEEQKKILEVWTGTNSFSRSASSIAGSWLLPVKRWANGSLRICAAAASTSSSLP